VRFGKVMRTDQLFERPMASLPLNRHWSLPRRRVYRRPSHQAPVPKLAQERKRRHVR